MIPGGTTIHLDFYYPLSFCCHPLLKFFSICSDVHFKVPLEFDMQRIVVATYKKNFL